MLVIAERINATRSRIARAMEERDADLIAAETRKQTEAGASFIDVNAGSKPEQELESLEWAVGIVQQNTDLPLCIDSANPDVLRAGLALVEGDTVMLNSVTAEEEKLADVIPIAAESTALLVALAMDDDGIPTDVDGRVAIAARIVEAAEAAGVDRTRLYVDPCVQPLSTSPDQVLAVRQAVGAIKAELPGVNTTCGLSNVSFGLPGRGLVNRIYLSLLIAEGLDSAIIDPTAAGMMEAVYAAEALAGRDDFCMNYISAMRAAQAR